MPASRVETFSDGVFAIAITLLVLEFHVPAPGENLVEYLLAQWPSFMAYGISVLLIGLVWANHFSMFVHIKRVDRKLMFFNVLLMANVAFLPFPTELLAHAFQATSDIKAATFFYGLTITLGGLAHNAVWLHVARHPELQSPSVSKYFIVTMRNHLLLGPISYGSCTLLSLVSPCLAIIGYAALIVFYWLPSRGEKTAFSATASS